MLQYHPVVYLYFYLVYRLVIIYTVYIIIIIIIIRALHLKLLFGTLLTTLCLLVMCQQFKICFTCQILRYFQSCQCNMNVGWLVVAVFLKGVMNRLLSKFACNLFYYDIQILRVNREDKEGQGHTLTMQSCLNRLAFFIAAGIQNNKHLSNIQVEKLHEIYHCRVMQISSFICNSFMSA